MQIDAVHRQMGRVSEAFTSTMSPGGAPCRCPSAGENPNPPVKGKVRARGVVGEVVRRRRFTNSTSQRPRLGGSPLFDDRAGPIRHSKQKHVRVRVRSKKSTGPQYCSKGLRDRCSGKVFGTAAADSADPNLGTRRVLGRRRPASDHITPSAQTKPKWLCRRCAPSC